MQLIPVGGEPLRQVQAVGQHKDGKARSRGHGIDELEHLQARKGLVVDRGVQHVVEDDVKRSALRGCWHVHKGIHRQRASQGRTGIRVGVHIVLFKTQDPLRSAVFRYRKILLLQTEHRLVAGIQHHHVHQHPMDGRVQHQAAISGFRWARSRVGWRMRLLLRTCRNAARRQNGREYRRIESKTRKWRSHATSSWKLLPFHAAPAYAVVEPSKVRADFSRGQSTAHAGAFQLTWR
jgi:hypothetical protein